MGVTGSGILRPNQRSKSLHDFTRQDSYKTYTGFAKQKMNSSSSVVRALQRTRQAVVEAPAEPEDSGLTEDGDEPGADAAAAGNRGYDVSSMLANPASGAAASSAALPAPSSAEAAGQATHPGAC